jgi:uncharacterized protein YkwD
MWIPADLRFVRGDCVLRTEVTVVDPSWHYEDVEDFDDLPPRRRKALRIMLVAGVVVLGLTVVAVLAAFATSGSSPTVSAAGSTASPAQPAPVLGLPSTEAPMSPPAGSSPTPQTSTTTKAPPANGRSMPMEEAVVRLVNEARSKAGCQPLAVDARLATAARAHSMDMAVHNYFSHTTPQGVTVGTRVTNSGYRWSLVGENIAEGQRDANAVMRAWLNSPGHRANILNCRFRNIGVGLAFGARHTPVWTQDFGTQM